MIARRARVKIILPIPTEEEEYDSVVASLEADLVVSIKIKDIQI